MDKNPSPDATILTPGREPHYGEMMRAKLARADERRLSAEPRSWTGLFEFLDRTERSYYGQARKAG